jgi:hypothetical protein
MSTGKHYTITVINCMIHTFRITLKGYRSGNYAVMSEPGELIAVVGVLMNIFFNISLAG